MLHVLNLIVAQNPSLRSSLLPLLILDNSCGKNKIKNKVSAERRATLKESAIQQKPLINNILSLVLENDRAIWTKLPATRLKGREEKI